MIRPSIKGARLVAIFLLGMLLFNFPLLNLFDRPAALLGVPLLYAYVFAAWVLVIGLMIYAIEKRDD